MEGRRWKLPRRYRYDPLELRFYQLLGQRLADREPVLKDYACNLNAEKLAALDLFLNEGAEGLREEEKETLEFVRKILRQQGRALWIMSADPLTNLALAVGKTIRVIDAGKEEEEEKP